MPSTLLSKLIELSCFKMERQQRMIYPLNLKERVPQFIKILSNKQKNLKKQNKLRKLNSKRKKLSKNKLWKKVQILNYKMRKSLKILKKTRKQLLWLRFNRDLKAQFHGNFTIDSSLDQEVFVLCLCLFSSLLHSFPESSAIGGSVNGEVIVQI